MSSALTPEVLWAQRSNATDPEKNIVFLTIVAADIPESSAKLDIQPTSLTFAGYSHSKKAEYNVSLEFYAEVDPAESKTHYSSRGVECVLRKKEPKEEFWPRLTKDSKKLHFLKTDFDKWVDEDEQEEVPEDPMGGMGGMPGGMGGMDFSKLGGGAGGMPDLSLGDMGGMGGMEGVGEGDDDDDEDMPELEDEAEGKGKEPAEEGESKPKIEEVS